MSWLWFVRVSGPQEGRGMPLWMCCSSDKPWPCMNWALVQLGETQCLCACPTLSMDKGRAGTQHCECCVKEIPSVTGCGIWVCCILEGDAAKIGRMERAWANPSCSNCRNPKGKLVTAPLISEWSGGFFDCSVTFFSLTILFQNQQAKISRRAVSFGDDNCDEILSPFMLICKSTAVTHFTELQRITEC